MEYTKNTDPNYFDEYQGYSNCGSFAFNVEEWYDPEIDFEESVGYIDDWIVEMHNNGYSNDEIADIYTEAITERILNDFFGEIREVYYPSDVNSNEELIALRGWCHYDEDDCSNYADYDFHFKVFRNGIWQEKCGRQPVKFCTEDEWSYGTRTYNSITIYFAHEV